MHRNLQVLGGCIQCRWKWGCKALRQTQGLLNPAPLGLPPPWSLAQAWDWACLCPLTLTPRLCAVITNGLPSSSASGVKPPCPRPCTLCQQHRLSPQPHSSFPPYLPLPLPNPEPPGGLDGNHMFKTLGCRCTKPEGLFGEGYSVKAVFMHTGASVFLLCIISCCLMYWQVCHFSFLGCSSPLGRGGQQGGAVE